MHSLVTGHSWGTFVSTVESGPPVALHFRNRLQDDLCGHLLLDDPGGAVEEPMALVLHRLWDRRVATPSRSQPRGGERRRVDQGGGVGSRSHGAQLSVPKDAQELCHAMKVHICLQEPLVCPSQRFLVESAWQKAVGALGKRIAFERMVCEVFQLCSRSVLGDPSSSRL